jgi:HJR/Mrr/RecB family endonuclease
MNPEQYERHVAAELTREGWKTSVSRLSGDLGVDVLAERRGRRLAVQAKMYGASTTKVNHEQVMCLHGAAAYADCPEMMLATDGQADRPGPEGRSEAGHRGEAHPLQALFNNAWRNPGILR